MQGGIIQSNSGIDVKETGSEYNVRTQIILGSEQGENQELLEEMEKLKKDVEKIDQILGDQDPSTLLNQTSAAQKEKIIKLLKFKTNAQKRIRAVKQEIKQEKQQHFQEASSAEAKIRGTAHPETEIIISGRRYLLDKPYYNATFYFDLDKNYISTK